MHNEKEYKTCHCPIGGNSLIDRYLSRREQSSFSGTYC